MRIFISIFFFSCTIYSALGQFGESLAKGGQSLALAGSDAHIQGISSAFINQAGLAELNGLSAIANAQQQYGIAELNDISLAIGLQAGKSGAFGLTLASYGIDEYRESVVGICYARKIAKSLNIGARLSMLNVNIPNFSSRFLPIFDLGAQANILPKLRLAAHLQSPINIEISDSYSVPTKMSLGFAYLPSDKLTLSLEAEKYIDRPFAVLVGVDYKVIELLSLRFGAGTTPGTISGGIGLHIKSWTIEGAVSNHEVLGFTSGVSLLYRLNKKAQE